MRLRRPYDVIEPRAIASGIRAQLRRAIILSLSTPFALVVLYSASGIRAQLRRPAFSQALWLAVMPLMHSPRRKKLFEAKQRAPVTVEDTFDEVVPFSLPYF